jgi:hypothetical protein
MTNFKKRVMRFGEEEVTDAQLLQQERRWKFAPQAAERIRATESCLFSLLPYEELSRMTGEWYEACSQAMLRGNYAPIDKWVRSQSSLASSQGFAPVDLLQLLWICRRSAIETENWNEDIFSSVDEVMQEVFGTIHGNTTWNMTVPLENNTSVTKEAEASVPNVEVEQRTIDRRRFTRNRLRFPIRVSGSGSQGQFEEITETQSVSRGGLYFVAYKEYEKEQILTISFPYWNQPGGINREYATKVVRLDSKPDGTWGVGVDFQESLGRKIE